MYIEVEGIALSRQWRGTSVDREFPADVHLRSRLQSRRPTRVYLNTNITNLRIDNKLCWLNS